jgi:hypothetical protein
MIFQTALPPSTIDKQTYIMHILNTVIIEITQMLTPNHSAKPGSLCHQPSK